MRQSGHFFTGLRIRNDCGQLLVNEEWGDEPSEWVKHQYIPPGHEIIGLKWFTPHDLINGKYIYIRRLGFNLWKPVIGVPEMTIDEATNTLESIKADYKTNEGLD